MDNKIVLAYLQRALNDSTDGPHVAGALLLQHVKTLVWMLQEEEKARRVVSVRLRG